MPVLLFRRDEDSFSCIIVSIQHGAWIRRVAGELRDLGNQSGEPAMAKNATAKARPNGKKTGSKSRAVVERRIAQGDRRSSDAGMGDAFIKLLQSPLAAELVAVAATAALGAVAEHGFTTTGGTRG